MASVSEWHAHVSHNGRCLKMANTSEWQVSQMASVWMASVFTWQLSRLASVPNGKCPQVNCLRMATVAWQMSDWQVSEGQVSASPTLLLNIGCMGKGWNWVSGILKGVPRQSWCLNNIAHVKWPINSEWPNLWWSSHFFQKFHSSHAIFQNWF